jgi:hypothetical protein
MIPQVFQPIAPTNIERETILKQKIVGFHQDAFSDWVADLACGHTQHVRHNPPWVNHPWVVTIEGRQQWLGAILQCKKCDAENL